MRLDSIVGTRVNRFTVEEKIRTAKATGGSEILYKCLCDCGKTFYAPSKTLQRHPPRDCGCGIRTPLPEEIQDPPVGSPSIETASIEKPSTAGESPETTSVPLRWQDVSIPDSKMSFFFECLKQKLKSSKQVYRGVKLKKFLNRYHAYIRVNNEEIGLGTYADINDAAIARLKAEIFYRGGVQVRTIGKRKSVSKPKVVCEHIGVVDRMGERHSAFVVLKYAGPKGNKEMWLCKCDCGNHFFASSSDIETETVKDCGCGLANGMRKPYKHHLCSSFSKYEVGGTNLAMWDNDKLNVRNKSGIRGVYFDSKSGKWVAKLVFKGITHREFFNTKKEAVFKREEMKTTLFVPVVNQLTKQIHSTTLDKDSKAKEHHELRFKILT